MPNKRKINDNELGYLRSRFTDREREKGSALGSPKGRTRTEKLILDQNNKAEYMVHYRMLKFYDKIS